MDFDREAVLASFLAEAIESLDLMEESVLEMESGSSSPELLHNIFRSAHTIKGNASSLDLQTLAGFAHLVEDLLDALRGQQAPLDNEMTSLLLKAVDELRLMVPAAVAGAHELTPEQEILKKRIASQVQRHAQAGTNFNPWLPEVSTASAGKSDIIPSMPARTIRADISRLDRMVDLTGEIAITQGRLRRMLEQLEGRVAGDLLEVQREAERLFMVLHEEVMRVRMVTVGPMFRQLARSVRDIASSHGKLARLEISGANVEVDTKVLEHLKDPLLHMIRNALDHGIETPEVRKGRGKDPRGLITLSTVHSNGSIAVTLEDDGAGIDRKKIMERARQMGLLSQGERISDQELYRLIFKAGFSTADSVTDLSGRGVGMDVVRRNIDKLRGAVDISSEEGQRTTIRFRLPLTLAIIDGFSVTVGADTFVIPMDYVTECAEIAPEERGPHSAGVFNLRGSAVPYVRLRGAYYVQGAPPARENVVIVQVGEFRAGIAVDRLLGDVQAVIKPLGKVFRKATGFAGSTVLGDGRVGLIIDVPGLLSEIMQSNLQAQPGQ